ncbi:MAG: EamA family transporter RarD [Pseudomonadota bacterium]
MSDDQQRSGFLFALMAFLIWGTLPLFWKFTEHLDPVEVTAHRALWAVPFAGIICWVIGRTGDILPTFKSPKKIGILFLCSCLVSFNWAVFIWAIGVERVLDTALAYYINPLLSVLLAFLFLRERFTRLQLSAIVIAGSAVLLLTVLSGQFPWISVFLAATFGFYGLLRKTVDVGPTQGFMVEVILIFPIVATIVGWKIWQGNSALLLSPGDAMLMVLAGPATAIPLIMFASGAKRLRLSTVGLMQFIVPTLLFLTSVFVFGEPLQPSMLIAFVMIWFALILYAISILRGEVGKRKSPATKRMG